MTNKFQTTNSKTQTHHPSKTALVLNLLFVIWYLFGFCHLFFVISSNISQRPVHPPQKKLALPAVPVANGRITAHLGQGILEHISVRLDLVYSR
jgi:hypothetical protein